MAYRVAALISPDKDIGSPFASSAMLGDVVQCTGGCNEGVSCAAVHKFSYAAFCTVDHGEAAVLNP
jgi:hypothetical protein